MAENAIKTRNSSIDIFRYICAVMIVSIHTSPFAEINETLSYIFSTVITNIAVPYFFAVAGYFFIQKLEQGKKPFLPYIKRLLTTYCIWTAIYYVLDFIDWGYASVKGFVASSIYTFFVTGSHYHLWFFLALMFCVCAATLFFKLRCQKLMIPISLVCFLLGCLGSAYFNLGADIPVWNKIISHPQFYILRKTLFSGFPFFVGGYLVFKIKDKALNCSNKKLFSVLLASALLWLAELFLVSYLELNGGILISLMLYPLICSILMLLIKNPIPKYFSLSQKSRVLANFTYYAHPFFISVLTMLGLDIPETLLFILITALTFGFGLLIYKLNNKFLNKLVY